MALGIWKLGFGISARQRSVRLDPLAELQTAAEILDRPRDTFFKIDPRLPAENFPGAADVGLPHFRIVDT